MAVGTTNYPTSLDTVVELVEAANNAADTLSAGISAGDASLILADAAEFAASGIVAIENELLSYTGKSGNTLTGLTRGIEGTTAASHSSGADVRQVITAASHNVQSAAIIALEQKLGTGTDIAWAQMSPLTANRLVVTDGAGDVTVSSLTHDATNAVIGNIGGLDFDTTPTATPTTARMVWDDTHGTVNLTLKGGTVGVDIGQTTVARVVNKTVTNINLLRSNYQVVRIVSAQGQRLAISLAQGNAEPNSTDVIGLVAENIANNQEGFIVARGLITEINTTGSLQGETWADGDILYLSPTTAGGLTKVEPQAPNHLVIVGYVVYAHSQHGKIYVAIQTSWETKELHDVKITGTPVAGSLLIRNATTGVWENATLTAGSNITITNADKSITIAGTGGVASVSGTSPVVSSGGSTPAISLASGYGDTQNPYASKTANHFLAAPNGTAGAPTFRAIVAADIPTLNQNTTGTASNVTGTVAIANGGTGQTTQQAALNALAGAATSGQYLRGNGTNVVMSAIQAGDVPTLNQNTTGTASNVTGTVAIANGGTGATTAPNARTNLGATTVGGNLFTLTNPSAITFPRFNADNTVSALNAADFRTAIGAGTGNGTVTGVTATSPVASSGGTAPVISLSSGYGDTQNPYAAKTANQVLAGPTTGAAAAPAFRALVATDIPAISLSSGVTGTLPVANGGTGVTTVSSGQLLIGTSAGGFAASTLTAGSNVTITNGSGAITIAASSGATPGGSDTQVQFNDGGSALGGDAGFTYNKTTNTATVEQLNLGTVGSARGILRLRGNTSGEITVQPRATAGTYTLTLPDNDGDANQVLTTDGSGVLSWATASSGGGSNSTADGRLTLTSGTPVTTSDVTAATTIYYTPYVGNGIALFDGSSTWTVRTFSELSLSLSGFTANTNYDVFAYWTGSAVALEAESWGTNTAYNITGVTVGASTVVTYTYSGTRPFQTNGTPICIQGITGNVNTILHNTWSFTANANVSSTSGTITFHELDTTGLTYTSGGTIRENKNTRATALTLQNGVWVKSGATTRRYLGTIRINGTGGQTEDSILNRLVWNNNNRIKRLLYCPATLERWTVSRRTGNYVFIAAQNDQRRRVQIICGLEEDMVKADVTGCYQSIDFTNSFMLAGVGLNRSDENSTWTYGRQYLTQPNASNQVLPVYGTFEKTLLGFHYLHWTHYASNTGVRSYGWDAIVAGADADYKLRQLGLGGEILG